LPQAHRRNGIPHYFCTVLPEINPQISCEKQPCAAEEAG